jgi:hypothetical protein
LPPLLEQLNGSPGNVTRIWSFFAGAGRPTHSASEALLIWADALTSAWRPCFVLAWGNAYTPRGTWPLLAVAVLLVSANAALAVRGREEPVLARVSAVVAIGAVLSWLSVTRIVGELGSYQVFWIAAIGALLIGALVGHALRGIARKPVLARCSAIALGVIIVTALVGATVGTVARARDYAITQVAHRSTRYAVAVDTASHLPAIGARHPRFDMVASTWSQGAGLVLHAYRQGFQVAVDDRWVPVFGAQFAATGTEDVSLQVATRCGEGHRVAARGDGLCVYELPGNRRPARPD